MTFLPTRNDTQRRTLFSACLAHAMHDGFIDGILIFLPIFQTQFALSYAAVGLLRGTATGTMATLQIPAGRLAERVGGRLILAAGTAIAALGFLVAGLSTGLATVFLGLALIGFGASVQHPIASEVIAAAYVDTRRRMALGVYNFMGDVGKTIVPPLAALLLVVLDWRIVCAAICALGLVVAVALLASVPDERAHATLRPVSSAQDTQAPTPPAFRMLMVIGVLDSATRMAFLTFLPFLLATKGGSLETTGLALSLIFAGGAAGKFFCAWLATRVGAITATVITECVTAGAIVAMAVLPLVPALFCLPLLGAALNGTSSVLYGSVAELVPDAIRRRAFAQFYTATVGSGALAPVVVGLFSDRLGLTAMLGIAAALALAVVPVALLLRPAFAAIDDQAALSGASTSSGA